MSSLHYPFFFWVSAIFFFHQFIQQLCQAKRWDIRLVAITWWLRLYSSFRLNHSPLFISLLPEALPIYTSAIPSAYLPCFFRSSIQYFSFPNSFSFPLAVHTFLFFFPLFHQRLFPEQKFYLLFLFLSQQEYFRLFPQLFFSIEDTVFLYLSFAWHSDDRLPGFCILINCLNILRLIKFFTGYFKPEIIFRL